MWGWYLGSISYDNVTYSIYDDGAHVGYANYDFLINIIIPDSVEYKGKKYPVTSMGTNTFKFKEMTKLKNIVIPSTIQEISSNPFGQGWYGSGKTIYNLSHVTINGMGAKVYAATNLGGATPLFKQKEYIKGAELCYNDDIQIEGISLKDDNIDNDNRPIISHFPDSKTWNISELEIPTSNLKADIKFKIRGLGTFTFRDYRIHTNSILARVYYEETQSTLDFTITPGDKTAHAQKVEYQDNVINEENGRYHLKISNLPSNYILNPTIRIYWNESTKYNDYTLKYIDRGGFYHDIRTKSISPQISKIVTPTIIKANGSYNEGDAIIYKTELGFAGKFVSGNNYISDILAPNTTYNMEYRVYTGENYYEKASLQVTTPALELTTTKEAKSVSNTTAIISATTNLDEMDTRAGFEWRRYDAPDLVPSSRANCPIIDGVMMGALKNLNTNTYYKFRPYYVDINGKEYFGDWSAFGTADAYVYFDPTVRTYSVSSIEDNRAVVRGCAVAGSDAIEEQGFEYWPVDSENVPSMRQLMAMANKQTVKADGQWMTATLSNLNSGQTYAVRAYVKTAKETTYGNTETFTTTNITGINKVFKSSQGLDVKIVGQSRSHVTLNVEGMQGRGRYLLYNLNGAMICNGEIEANAFSQDINTSQLSSGIYLLRVADNKQCKTIRIIIK